MNEKEELQVKRKWLVIARNKYAELLSKMEVEIAKIDCKLETHATATDKG
jgi:hypothetical protein